MKARAQTPRKDSIRVDTGAKRIEVNDDGEYITLNFADQSFPMRFYEMMDDFEKKRPEYERRAQELDQDESLTQEERTRRGLGLNLEMHAYLKTQIDALFGPETCRKVFGDIVPGVDLYTEFLNQLTPYFEKYGKERQKKLEQKYSAARRGNV